MQKQLTCIWQLLPPAAGKPCPRSASPRPPRRAPAAFTLVELLVVIGIISVLIGILLPTVAKARKQADTAHCLSNVRNMQIAQWNYAVDNRGYLVQGGLAHGGVHANEDITWFNTLNRYYGGKLSPRCKADTSLFWDTPVPASLGPGKTPQYRRCSYGINAFLDRDLCPWGPGFSEPKPGGQYVKIENIRKPTTTIQFAEMAYTGDYAASDHVHPNLFASPTTPLAPSMAIPRNVAAQLQINAHGGSGWKARANYGFIDGHAETLTLAEVYTSLYLNRFDPAAPQLKQ